MNSFPFYNTIFMILLNQKPVTLKELRDMPEFKTDVILMESYFHPYKDDKNKVKPVVIKYAPRRVKPPMVEGGKYRMPAQICVIMDFTDDKGNQWTLYDGTPAKDKEGNYPLDKIFIYKCMASPTGGIDVLNAPKGQEILFVLFQYPLFSKDEETYKTMAHKCDLMVENKEKEAQKENGSKKYAAKIYGILFDEDIHVSDEELVKAGKAMGWVNLKEMGTEEMRNFIEKCLTSDELKKEFISLLNTKTVNKDKEIAIMVTEAMEAGTIKFADEKIPAYYLYNEKGEKGRRICQVKSSNQTESLTILKQYLATHPDFVELLNTLIPKKELV